MSDSDHRWMFSAEELAHTPSIRDGMPPAQEKIMRQKSCLFIVEMARLLKRNELVLHAACCIFQRFFAVQSFAKHSRFIVAAACLFLAAKIEESPVSLDNVVDVFLYIRRDKIEKSELSREMKEVRDKILVAERVVLQTIGFDLHISHPIGNCLEYLRALKSAISSDAKRQLVRQLAMNIVTDSFGSTLCLTQSARVIAAAAALLAIIEADVPPPSTAASLGAAAALGGGVSLGGRSRSFGEPASARQHSWLDLILSTSKVEENVLKNTCFQIISMYEERVIPVGEEGDKGGGEPAGNALGAASSNGIPGTAFTRLRGNFVKEVAMGNQLRNSESEVAPTSQSTVADATPLLTVRAPLSRATEPPESQSAPPASSAPAAPMAAIVPPTPEYMPPPATPDLVPPPTPDLIPPPDMPLGHASSRIPTGSSNGVAGPPPPPPPRVVPSGRIPPPPPPPLNTDISRKRASQSIESESVTSLTAVGNSGQAILPPTKKTATTVAY